MLRHVTVTIVSHAQEGTQRVHNLESTTVPQRTGNHCVLLGGAGRRHLASSRAARFMDAFIEATTQVHRNLGGSQSAINNAGCTRTCTGDASNKLAQMLAPPRVWHPEAAQAGHNLHRGLESVNLSSHRRKRW